MIYRLTSTTFAHAPGIIRYACHMQSSNTAKAKEIIRSWTQDELVIDKILHGDYTIDGETVVVEILPAERFSNSKICYTDCGICGYVPQDSMKDEANRQPLRWWDPDDGWKIGTLCRHCADDHLDVRPSKDDYAYHTTNGVADNVDTDENPMDAIPEGL